MSATRRLLAQRQEMNRRQEAVRSQHMQALKEDRVYRFAAESEQKQLQRQADLETGGPRAQYLQSLARQRQEEEERARQERQEHDRHAAQQLRAAEEEAAREEAARQEEQRQAKIRQVVRESSQELRDLERLIKSAYVGKERVLQLKQAQLDRQRAKLLDIQYDEQLRAQMQREQLLEEQKEQQQEVVRRQYGAELEQQIESLESRKHEEYLRFQQEKQLIDEVVRKIIEEDERAVQQKLAKQQETKEFIDAALKQRREWKEQEQRRIEEEDRKIAEYTAVQENRAAERQEKHAAQEAARETLYNELAEKLERKTRERQELDDMLAELGMEETYEKHRAEQAKLLEKRIKQRLEMVEAHRLQVEDRQRREVEAAAQEAAYRQMLAEQMAEQDRLDQLSAQKKRMKQAEHRRVIDQLVQDRNRRREAERQAEIEQANGRDEIGRWRREIIEQERQRILRENAVNLLGYLPKGIFRDEQDLQLFDEDFRRTLAEQRAATQLAVDSDDTDSIAV